jgi:oxygen-independent coproporphyrinogen III oxidase
LYKAAQNGKLHRNFMGYTTQNSAMLLGLGVSSISDAGIAFAQNEKTLHNYYQSIAKKELAVTKGYFLTDEDVAFRKYILDVSCQGKTTFQLKHMDILKTYTFPELTRLKEDGLVEWDVTGLQVTPLGRHFIRNICRAFDLHLLRSAIDEKPVFSKAI